MKSGWSVPILALLFAPAALASPTLNQVNDFENGQVSGWTNGGSAPDPTNITSGGPAGASDNYLRVTSTGGFGAGSRLVTLNNNQRWTGNFNTDRIDAVTMDLKNFAQNPASQPLRLRIAFEGGGGTWFASTTPVLLNDGAWHSARFDLTTSALTRIEGSATLANALANVTEFRIVHSAAPNYRGDVIAASFGVDNIRAVPEPAGLAAAAMLLPLLRRRRRS
jgi:hypothetical protein